MNVGMTVPRQRRDDPLDVVRQLVTTIGARQATSLGEARAAAYVDSRLRRAGMQVSAHTFRAPAGLGLIHLLLALLAVLAVLLSLWWPLPALLVALYGLMLTVSDMLAAPLPSLARSRQSQNIVATRARTGADSPAAPLPPWRVVLLAPLDSPLHSGRLRHIVGRQLGALVLRISAFALLVLALLLLLISGHPLWWLVQLLSLVGLFLTLLPGHIGPRQDALLGSASALAALLAIVEQLGSLRSVEIWAVALGATTTSSNGLHDLLERYPFPKENTLFIALQNMEGTQLCCAPREGAAGQFAADPQLLHLATLANMHDPQMPAQSRPLYTPLSLASLLHSRGYRVLTLHSQTTARRPTAGEDVLALFQGDTLEQAIRLVIGMLRRLNQDEREGERRKGERRQSDPTGRRWPGGERRKGERRQHDRRTTSDP